VKDDTKKRPAERYRLKLFITGTTPVSGRAVSNVRKLCEHHIPDCFDLEVIDVARKPELAKQNQLIAVPTLIKEMPLPVRRFLGDMSSTEKLIDGLGLKPVPA
jgi:circadian clock protein KaiB